MIVLESKLAKIYAVAFLNLSCRQGLDNDLCSPPCVASIKRLYFFVTQHRIFQAVLNLPSLPTKQKKEIILQVATKLQVQRGIENVMLLLLKHKRIDLLGDVLKKIVFLHEERANKRHFFVTTSHDLSSDEQKEILELIDSLVPEHASASFAIDTSLISGIKIKGHGLLLERSIAKQLRKLEHSVLQQEES